MSNKTKAKEVKGVSPKGIFKYPNIVKPDYGTDEFPKKAGEYNLRLIVDEGPAREFIKKMQPELDKAVEAARERFQKLPVATRKKLKDVTVNDFYTELYDEDENPTGQFEFRFRTAASGVNKKGEKWTRKVPIFDAKGKPIFPKEVWSGSEGKVAFTVAPYFVEGTGAAGITFYLDAVQITKLVSAGSRSAEDFGFGEEEGFSAEDLEDDQHGFSDESDDDDDTYEGDDNDTYEGDAEEDFDDEEF